MDYKNEIARRDKKIEDLKKEIKAKNEEIAAMHELLDCAAANIMVLVKEADEIVSISKKAVSEALGKYSLKAKDDGNGNYILEILGE
ncbi:MAG: hypothetical protein E7406_05630 [Ruminococcaceae bacterium]|nr:hypothetical protein [Oscillospiraceae bacterium]